MCAHPHNETALIYKSLLSLQHASHEHTKTLLTKITFWPRLLECYSQDERIRHEGNVGERGGFYGNQTSCGFLLPWRPCMTNLEINQSWPQQHSFAASGLMWLGLKQTTGAILERDLWMKISLPQIKLVYLVEKILSDLFYPRCTGWLSTSDINHWALISN